MAKQDAAVLLAESDDQESVRNDLAIFFGQRSDYYLQKYEKMHLSKRRNKSFVSWNWATFLMDFAWFFYRKMYLVGAAIILLPVLIVVLFDLGPSAHTSTTITFAMLANPMYIRHALKNVAKANVLGLQGEERVDYLRRAGGTSKVAGGFGLIILLCSFALAIIMVLGKKL